MAGREGNGMGKGMGRDGKGEGIREGRVREGRDDVRKKRGERV